ncbi:uncharacterized protein LOC120459725 isoform X2 [Pimephales promelas]|uniref:uncharacterized protein LOC120459725 isoform X2 n=1 Tax=Pimephales promelas TaxID=90988 RepID=UPI00195587F6|nr:uncharacterized protein LOC120459725 isoform X2 [Pimephales promelas]
MAAAENEIQKHTSSRKKAEARKTGGGPAPPPLSNAEEMALSLNAGRPMAEGIPGGTSSEPVTPEDLSALIIYSDGNICLLEPPVPIVPYTVDDGDEETISATTDRPTESVEEQQEEGPSTSGAQMNTLPVKELYRLLLIKKIEKNSKEVVYLDRQIQKADLEIDILKLKLEVSVWSQVHSRKYCNYFKIFFSFFFLANEEHHINCCDFVY